MNVVREEPSSHDMKLLTDSQDGVGHVLLLELSLPPNGSRFSAAAAPRASEYQSGGRRASISEPAAAGGATRHGNQRGAAGSCNRVGRQPRPRALLRVRIGYAAIPSPAELGRITPAERCGVLTRPRG